MRKISTFIWGVIKLVIASGLVGLAYYLNSEFRADLTQPLGDISKIIFVPLISITLLVGFIIAISGGIKLVLTSFSKSKTIKILSIILVVATILLLGFYGHNIATFIHSIQM